MLTLGQTVSTFDKWKTKLPNALITKVKIWTKRASEFLPDAMACLRPDNKFKGLDHVSVSMCGLQRK